MDIVSRGRGRPRKFGRPSRAVTVTLPDDVIARLRAINADLGRAIVATVERHRSPGRASMTSAGLTRYGRRSVIVVPPVTAIKHLAGVQLVPLDDNRALIALEHPDRIPQLELDIRDALDRDDVRPPERSTFEIVAAILKRARASDAIDVKERTIIVLEPKRRRRVH